MKKLALILSIIALSFFVKAADTVFIFQENSMIKIVGLYVNPDPVYVNPSSASLYLTGTNSNIVIYDGIMKQKYTLGTYDEVFNQDTIGFASINAAFSYLSSFISNVNKPVNNKLISYKSDTTITDSAIWIPTDTSKYFVINSINYSISDTFNAILKLYSGAGDTIINQYLFGSQSILNNNQINLIWEGSTAGDSIFINTSDTLYLNIILSGYEY